MSANRPTRRQALATGLGVLAAGRLPAAPVPKADPNASWVGKIVLPRKYPVRGIFPAPSAAPADPNPDDPSVQLTPGGVSYVVKGEKGSRVELLYADGTAFWVEKEDLVRLADAREFFTRALRTDEKDTFALNARGWAYYLNGESAKAIADFDAVLKLLPADTAGPVRRWEVLANRGLVLAERGEFEKAFKDFDGALELRPSHPLVRTNRGFAYELRGEYRKALAEYDAVLDSYPSETLARNNKAWVLATCPDENVRDGAEAVRLARGLCEATGDREGMYLDTLAAALAEAGKFDAAVKTQEKALADKSYAARYGEDGQHRLQLYKDRKPFRTEPVKK